MKEWGVCQKMPVDDQQGEGRGVGLYTPVTNDAIYGRPLISIEEAAFSFWFLRPSQKKNVLLENTLCYIAAE